MVHMSSNEMLPSCRHCAKRHLNKQQQQQSHDVKQLQPDKSPECVVPIHSETSRWPPLLSLLRKRPTKCDKLLNNESGRNQSNAKHTMSTNNSMASQSDNHNTNDQYMQCSTNHMAIVESSSQSTHSSQTMWSIASLVLAESSKMDDGLIAMDEVNALPSPPPPPPPLPSPLSSSSSASSPSTTILSTSNGGALHCVQKFSSQTCNKFMDSENLSSFSVNDRLASENANDDDNDNDDRDNTSDVNQCINKHGIVSKGSSRSLRTVSANHTSSNNNTNHNNYNTSNNNQRHPKKPHAYVKQRWPYAISSAMNIYSHVLLICVAIIVFGIRNALVLADDTPANAKDLALAENSGSK